MCGRILLLGGPTASGKSESAIALARTFGAEIIGADSRQVYRDMPIGTAAATAEQRAMAPHHLVSVLDPHERYSAARFTIDAMEAIEAIRRRGKRVIVAGGTGFYLRALAGGIALAPQYDAHLRERLAREAAVHPPEVLHAWLAVRDPARAAALHPGDAYRILRSIEIALSRSEAPERGGVMATLRSRGLSFEYAVLEVPLDELDARIETRVDAMLAAGFVEEAERIGAEAAAANAVGYPVAIAWSRGWCSTRELRVSLIRTTRRYARRQRAWFRNERMAHHLTVQRLAAYAREKLGWM